MEIARALCLSTDGRERQTGDGVALVFVAGVRALVTHASEP